MRRLLAAAAATAALAGLAATAAATIVLRVTPKELADTAHLVVEGKVAAVDVRWDDDHACINTYVTLSVDRVHKGTAAGAVVVKVPGGRVGEEEVRVEGTARFARDEEVVVFLWKDARGEWLVLGEGQGKFLVRRDGRTGARTVENSLKGLCMVVRQDPKGAAGEAARKPDRLSYDDLVAVVRTSVEEAARKAAAPKSGTAAPPATGGSDGPGAAAPAEGRDPAPPVATPDPPSGGVTPAPSTTTPDGGAPPPTKDAPAPRTGPPETPPPAPDAQREEGKDPPPEPAPAKKE